MKNFIIVGVFSLAFSNHVSAQTCNENVHSSTPSEQFYVNGSEVTDLTTGLIWQRCALGLSDDSCTTGTNQTYIWQEALQAGEDAGNNWRVPNIQELLSIVESRCDSPSINADIFPNTNDGYHWSSTPDAGSSVRAWYVSQGELRSNPKNVSQYLRLVRTASAEEVLDTDGDGVPDIYDAFPEDSTETVDTDDDGIGNNTDTDDDGDGIPDSYENTNGLDPLDNSDADLDSDGDHQINYDEYLHNTDPQDSTDHKSPLNFSFGKQGIANNFVLPERFTDEEGQDEVSFSGVIAELSDQRLVFTGSIFENTDDVYQVFSFMMNSKGILDTTYAEQGFFLSDIDAESIEVTLAVGEQDQHLIQEHYGNLTMLNANGSADTSFGTEGKINLGDNYEVLSTLNLTGGGYLFSGKYQAQSQYGFIAKYDQSGNLDTSYGTNGVSKFTAGANGISTLEITAMIKQTDDKIIVYAEDYGLARLNIDGSVDDTFFHELDDPTTSLSGLSLQADGKVLYIERGRNLVRLYSNGSIDVDFNAGETVDLSMIGFGASSNHIMTGQLPDGKIIVAKNNFIGDLSSFEVLKLETDGDVDITYDNDGISRYVSADYHQAISKPLMASNGDILMVTSRCEACTHVENNGVVIRFLMQTDTDGDGYADTDDAFPDDSNETLDTDNDGVGNNADYDDDGDGLPDSYEEQYSFLDPVNVLDTALDQDNDNYSNLAEFRAVTNPDDIENDPTDSLVYKIISPEGSDFDSFGTSIALSGDTAMVYGQIYNADFDITRYVYIFNKNENGQWLQSQKLTTDVDEVFNTAIAIYGDTALIGGKRGSTGIVFVYQKDDTGNWLIIEKLTASDGGYGGFGTSISLEENTALIGAYGSDDEGNHIGAAYIFEQGEDEHWVEKQILTAEAPQFYDWFAREVSLSGDTALIGAGGDSTNGNLAGAAYIFEKDANQQWQQQAKLLPDNGKETDLFAQSISLDGDTALIGAYRTDQAGGSSGSAYIFERDSSNNWLQIIELVADDAAYNDQFGYSVSLNKDKALIGARAQGEMADYAGASYLFSKNNEGNWIQQNKITAPDVASDESFGSTVVLTDNLMVIGTDLEDGNSFGSVYFIDVDTDGDGTGNNADSDDDGDGILDLDDAFPLDSSESLDTDGDLIGNNADTDDDNDGVDDSDDAFPLDNTESVDTDNDGTGDNADTDDDNDNIADELDGDPLSDEIGDITPPEFPSLSLVSINAAGLLTDITEYITIVAFDGVDGEVTAEIVGDSKLLSGHHLVQLSATDSAGNQAIATVEVNINPELSIEAELIVEASGTYPITLRLSGDAAVYPVTFDYNVTFNDAVIETTSMTISSGSTAQVMVNVDPDALTTDSLAVTLIEASNAFIGQANISVLTITEDNIAPSVQVGMEQGAQITSIVDANKGLVTFTAVVTDINNLDEHDILWTVENSVLSTSFVDSELDDDAFTFELNTEKVPEGNYTLQVQVSENNTQESLSSTLELTVIVEALAELSDNNDSDNDGISDSDEGHADSDNDGIVDYLDSDDNPTRLPSSDNNQPLQTRADFNMRLGNLSRVAQGAMSDKASLTLAELTEAVDEGAADTSDDGFELQTPLYNFIVDGLTQADNSAVVVIPLAAGKTIPEEAVFRKYNTVNGWFNFVEDVNNSISSAFTDENGNCPAANDASYTQGLTQGDNCFQLIIEDGGPNDADFTVNGKVEDPGAIALENAGGAEPESVNQAPSISIDTHDTSFLESTMISLISIGTDTDGDDLTYLWEQVSGPAVSFDDTTTAQVNITLPTVTSDETITLQVTVSDGDLTSVETTNFTITNVAEVITITPEKESSGGGSMGILLLLSVFVRMRKTMVSKKAA